METGSGLRHRSATIDGGNHEDNTKGQTTSSSLPPNENICVFQNSPDRNTSHPHLPTPQTNTKSKLETYKVQKKNYRSQKKEAAKELLSTITDPSVVLLGDWLKVRGTLKSWTKLWCVLKPGVLILYKSDKQKRSHWVGTILLNTCQLLERPSKKDGFCFKLFHPLDQSIWATKGPNGETIGAFVQPLPYSYCIFRAPSESAGKCWMDALELALKCTNLLKRSMTRSETCTPETNSDVTIPIGFGSKEGTLSTRDDLSTSIGEEYPPNHESHNHEDFSPMCMQESMNESDLERHFANQGNQLHIEDHAIHDDFSSEPGYHEHIEPDPTGILPEIYYKDMVSSSMQKHENSLDTVFLKKQDVRSKWFEKVSKPDCKSENERNSVWGGDIGNKKDYNVSQSVENNEKTVTRSFTLASDRVKSEQIPQPLGSVASFHRQGIPGKRVLHEKLDAPIKEAINRINRPQCRKDRFFELIAPFENISQKSDSLKTEASDPLLLKKEPGKLKRIYSPDTKKSSELTESFMKVPPPSSVEMVRPTVFHPQDEIGPVFKEGQHETTPIDMKLNPSAAKFLDTSSLTIQDPSHKNLQRISSEHNRKPMHCANIGEFKTRPSEHHLKQHKSSMLDTLSEMLSFHRDLKNQHDPKKRPTTDELYYALLALKIKNIRTETDKFELEINKLKMELNAMNMDLHPRSKTEAGSDIKSIPAAKQKINEMSTHLPFGNAKNTTASTEI